MCTSQTNTYQGIVATDGQQSYALFTYRCDLMLWSGNATIGFNTDGSFYQNHILSGTSDAKDIACLNSPLSMWSNVLFQLGMLQFTINTT